MKLWNLLRRRKLERDIAEELATHAAWLEEANRAAGTTRRFGSDLALRERTRAADVPLWLEESLRDVAWAGRALRRRPGFAALAIVTLALGIGATTAMVSAVRTVVINALPFPHANRLVMVERTMAHYHGEDPILLTPIIRKLRADHIFAAMGASGTLGENGTVYVHGFATEGMPALVTPDWFATMGVRPVLGRGFSPRGGEVIVSQKFFQHQLGGNRSALGRPLQVGHQLYTVVGVLAAGQEYPPRTDVWVSGQIPLDSDGSVIARLPQDVPLAEAQAQARAALAVIGHDVRSRGYGPDDIAGLTLGPLFSWRATPAARTTLWVLLAATAGLLLIACGNTANLLLARGLERQRELAVRRAMGASRGRLARLLLAEGLWLALLGGAAGAAFAALLVRGARFGPAGIPRLDAVRLNAPALAAAAGLALLCSLACALAPALQLTRQRSGELDPLHGGEQLTRARSLRRVLVAAEAALTLTLLIGGLLLARTVVNIEHVNLGLQPDHVTALRIFTSPPPPGLSEVQRTRFFAQRRRLDLALEARLAALPGVRDAGYANIPPFFSLEAMEAGKLGGRPAYGFINAGPGYFRTLRIPLLAGRAFSAADTTLGYSAETPIVINAALARELWPAGALTLALGAHLQWRQTADSVPDPAVVVGVVGDVHDQPGRPAPPRLYQANDGSFPSTIFFLRSALPPDALAAQVRAALPGVDAGLTMAVPSTLEDDVQTALGQPRFRALLMAALAALAWTLALVGLYGVLAFQVRQRRREIGVRMALGAGSTDVVRLVLGQSAAVLAAGLAVGGLLSWCLSRYLASLLFGVRALDPVTWLAAVASLLAAGLLASLVPARRALRVDAAETLRCE